MRTIEIAGVTVAPFALHVLEAAVLYALLRALLLRLNAYRLIWHRPLFDTALFVSLVSVVTLCQ